MGGCTRNSCTNSCGDGNSATVAGPGVGGCSGSGGAAVAWMAVAVVLAVNVPAGKAFLTCCWFGRAEPTNPFAPINDLESGWLVGSSFFNPFFGFLSLYVSLLVSTTLTSAVNFVYSQVIDEAVSVRLSFDSSALDSSRYAVNDALSG